MFLTLMYFRVFFFLHFITDSKEMMENEGNRDAAQVPSAFLHCSSGGVTRTQSQAFYLI